MSSSRTPPASGAPIGRGEVERIADLARLALAPEEAEAMARDLARMLDYVAQLDVLATDGVEPTVSAVPIATPLRPDRARPGLPAERALAGAPARAGRAFAVPAVIEGEEG